MRPRARTVSGAIILALVLACLPGAIFPSRSCSPDSERYLSLAWRIFHKGCYCNTDGSPHATTPPLYPCLAGIATVALRAPALRAPADAAPSAAATSVAAPAVESPPPRAAAPPPAEGLLGTRTHAAARVGLLLAQALLLLWSAHTLRRLAERAGVPPGDSWKVALLYGLSPLALAYAGRILSETLFVALLLTGLDLFCRDRATGQRSAPHPGPPRLARSDLTALAAGAALGLATLTRAILLPWVLLGPLFALALPRLRRRLLFACLGALLALTPWGLRNLHTFGTPELSPAAGTNALEYAAALAAPASDRAAALRAERGPEELSHPFQESRARTRAALRLIGREPPRFFAHAALSAPALLAPPLTDLLHSIDGRESDAGLLERLRQGGPGVALAGLLAELRGRSAPALIAAAVLCLWDLALTSAAACGLVLLALSRRRRRATRGHVAAATLLVPLALLLALAPIGAWHPRFRVPLLPAEALLAYAFVAGIRARRQQQSHGE